MSYKTQAIDYREPVLWGVVLYQEGTPSHGTILNVTPEAWEIAGVCPVQARHTLRMRLWPGYRRHSYLEIETATVLWVKKNSFGVVLTRVRAQDQAAIFALEQRTFGAKLTFLEDVHYC